MSLLETSVNWCSWNIDETAVFHRIDKILVMFEYILTAIFHSLNLNNNIKHTLDLIILSVSSMHIISITVFYYSTFQTKTLGNKQDSVRNLNILRKCMFFNIPKNGIICTLY